MRQSGAFRDPAGSVIIQNRKILRAVFQEYAPEYDLLMSSGLYEALVAKKLLIPHKILTKKSKNIHALLEPKLLPFISYPYEWCFSQLKQAALATLSVQKEALEKGMSLKDASAFNMQFFNGLPTLIDTLSFERYQEGQPWVAYKQFCMHFLCPLLLMSAVDTRLLHLFLNSVDGIPLDLTSKLLPKKTFANLHILTHIHIHAGFQKTFSGKKVVTEKKRVHKKSLLGILQSLEELILSLQVSSKKSMWEKYYSDNTYTAESFAEKKDFVTSVLQARKPKSVLDIGANTGEFSFLASSCAVPTVAIDNDHASVEALFETCTKKKDTFLLPLIVDIANPTPAIGWENVERSSFLARSQFDIVMALAVIHHLRISSGIPLKQCIQLFSRISSHIIVEFVPKSDVQVKKLLANRKDIFKDYTKDQFEKELRLSFNLIKKKTLKGTDRTLYFLKNKRTLII